MALVQCYDCGKFVEHDNVQLQTRKTAEVSGVDVRADVESKVNICRECADAREISERSNLFGLLCGVATYFLMQWVTGKENWLIAGITGVCVAFVSSILMQIKAK